jgi:hypothetical protein
MGIKTLQYGIGQAKGLYQGIDDNLLSMSYSPDCQNIDVSDGIISTRKGSTQYAGSRYVGAPINLPYICYKIILVPGYIEASTYVEEEAFAIVPVYGTINGLDYHWYVWTEDVAWEESWVEVSALSDVNPLSCDYLQYTLSGTPYALLFSNDGAFKLNAYEISHGYLSVHVADLGGTPPSGKYCCLHRERVWVTGNATNPNYVYYSNAYDPEDWSTSGETGYINIITFDADSIVGIVNAFDDVVIFKKNSAWKVQGDIPSEYSVEQIYSAKGGISQKSIVADGRHCYFASSDGIYEYDGIACKAILTTEIKDAYNTNATDEIILTINEDKLFIWSKYTPYKTLIYDIKIKTVEVFYCGSIYAAIGNIYSAGLKVYKLNNTSLTVGSLAGIIAVTAYWITPENDCKYPAAKKKLREITFNAWGTTSAGASGGQVKITVYYNLNGTQKTKEKTVTLSTTRRPHRLLFNVTGRLFKYKIENVSGSAINVAGFTPLYEVDVV